MPFVYTILSKALFLCPSLYHACQTAILDVLP